MIEFTEVSRDKAQLKGNYKTGAMMCLFFVLFITIDFFKVSEAILFGEQTKLQLLYGYVLMN